MPILLKGAPAFAAASLAVALALAGFYMLLHQLLSRFWSTLSPWAGAVLAYFPYGLVYGLGAGGGLIFGRGEGQMGALVFLGVSLVLAGLRADPGCELMSIPALALRKHTHLGCLVFSPIDWLERKLARD